MADKKKKQYTNEGMDKSYRRLYSFVKPLFMLLFPFRKIHAENIPEGKVLICPNHFSDLDPLMVCFSVPKRSPIRVMAKQELMKVPANTPAVPIHRANRMEATIFTTDSAMGTQRSS